MGAKLGYRPHERIKVMNGTENVGGNRRLALHLDAEKWERPESAVVAFIAVFGMLALVVGVLWVAGP